MEKILLVKESFSSLFVERFEKAFVFFAKTVLCKMILSKRVNKIDIDIKMFSLRIKLFFIRFF